MAAPRKVICADVLQNQKARARTRASGLIFLQQVTKGWAWTRESE